MSLFKLAIYGGIGYCVYQTLFADMPSTRTGHPSPKGEKDSGNQGRPQQRQGGPSASRAPQRQQQPSGGTARLTGPGRGTEVMAKDAGGASTSHRVGRGVV